jgi:uncharacterized membrane protein YczE
MDPSSRSGQDACSIGAAVNLLRYAKKTVALMIGIIITAFGCSLTIKASVGLGAWDALALTVSNISCIKVGTIAIIFNSLCILGQLAIERKNFRIIQFMQFILVLIQGTFINFFVYTVFAGLRLSSYPMRIILIVFAYCVIAFGVMVIMETRIVRNPLEGVCQVAADRLGKPMGRIRQLLDIFLIVLALLLAFLSRTDYTIREGTLICMLMFGPLLDVYKKPVRKILDRLGI